MGRWGSDGATQHDVPGSGPLSLHQSSARHANFLPTSRRYGQVQGCLGSLFIAQRPQTSECCQRSKNIGLCSTSDPDSVSLSCCCSSAGLHRNTVIAPRSFTGTAKESVLAAAEISVLRVCDSQGLDLPPQERRCGEFFSNMLYSSEEGVSFLGSVLTAECGLPPSRGTIAGLKRGMNLLAAET